MRYLFRFVLAAVIGILIAFSPPSRAADNSDAATFILSLADTAIEVLRDNSATLEVREARLHDLLKRGFAMKLIGRHVAGRYWRKMSPAQQAEFQQLYSNWTLKIYSGRLGGYSGQTFKVIKAVSSAKSDIFVQTLMFQPDNSKPMAITWRVRKIGDTYLIVDVVVEGISMLATQKAEFAALLKGRGVEGLLQVLRARLSKLSVMSG